MRGLLPQLLLLLALIHRTEADCYITPCRRDVVIVLDASLTMGTQEAVRYLVAYFESFVSNWTINADGVRVAIVGYGFAKDIYYTSYLDTRESVEDHLQVLYGKVQYGLNNQTSFQGCVAFLNTQYTKTKNPVREGVQGKMLIFTSTNDDHNVIENSINGINSLKDSGYEIIIGTINTNESFFDELNVTYVFAIPNLVNVSAGITQNMTDQGICHYDPSFGSTTLTTCATTTPTTTPITRASTTTPRPTPPSSFDRECSCNASNIWLDIIFLIDVSASMGQSGLAQVQANIATLVLYMNIGQGERSVRVGLVTYASQANISHDLGAFANVNAFLTAIYSLKVVSDSKVNLEDAFKAGSRVELNSGRADNYQKVFIVYASAYASGGFEDPKNIANQIKEDGHNIITVAYIQSSETDEILKLGELASPRMSLTSNDSNLMYPNATGGLVGSLCQSNCYCKSNFEQYMFAERRMGACFRMADIDSSWLFSEHACDGMIGEPGLEGLARLVTVDSSQKNEFIKSYARIVDTETTKKTYFIGLRRNGSDFVWENGAPLDFADWDDATSQPNVSNGDCVVATQTTGFRIAWQTTNCITGYSRPMCESVACDSDHYCRYID